MNIKVDNVLREANMLFIESHREPVDQLLIASMFTGTRLTLEYKDIAGVLTTREISPVGLLSKDKKILAYCHTRAAIRSFKKDGIISLKIGKKQGEV